MFASRLVIIGLPSEGLQELSASLGASVATDEIISRAHDTPDDVRTVAPGRIMAGLSAALQADEQRCALLVYQTPWRFLNRQLKLSRSVPQTHAHFEWFARNACDFWSTYHTCLLALYGEHEQACLLLNGDRGIESDAVRALLHDKFGLEPDSAQASVPVHPASRNVNEEPYWQVVNRIAPDALELYALLESSAALLGRAPEFGFELFPHRSGRPLDFARAELKALAPVSRERLLVQQIHQLQEEIRRYAERERRREKSAADRWARKARSLWACAMGLLKLTPMKTRKQAKVIRSSGLFDETWYRKRYPDVARSGMDPVTHYLKFGAFEGRDPGPGFDTRWYLSAYDDVALSGINPLLHYIQSGRNEGRRPVQTRQPAAGH